MKFERIGNIFPIIRNGANIKQDKVTDGYPITRIETIADGTVDLNRVGYASIHDESYSEFYLKENDILMSHINSVSHLGKVALVNGIETKVIHGMNLLCLKADEKKIHPKYAFYFFKSPVFRTKIKRITKKSVNQASFNISNLKDIELPLPQLSDQLHIANLLSKAEKLIAQRKESIRLLDEFLKSTFLEMFGECTKNERNWKKIELKYFGEITTGNTPPRINDENYSSNFIEWIKTDNIPSDGTYITEAVEYLSETGVRYARTVEAGALLVACIAGSIQSVGRAALTNRKVSFNQQINAIQPNEEIEPLYLYWLFKISRKYIQDSASNGMKKILTKGGFENIKMIKPPIELQTQFAQIVEKTEALKSQYQQSLRELEQLYGSLSQRAFRGELTN